jgi:hypothetical protein
LAKKGAGVLDCSATSGIVQLVFSGWRAISTNPLTAYSQARLKITDISVLPVLG